MDESPTLPELMCFGSKEIDIIEEIGIKYNRFGVSLLQDKTGAKIEAIVTKCRGDVYETNQKVLSRWIRGEGKKPVSWATLATELDKCRLKELAKSIRTETSK